jgi:hypothetical protein
MEEIPSSAVPGEGLCSNGPKQPPFKRRPDFGKANYKQALALVRYWDTMRAVHYEQVLELNRLYDKQDALLKANRFENMLEGMWNTLKFLYGERIAQWVFWKAGVRPKI